MASGQTDACSEHGITGAGIAARAPDERGRSGRDVNDDAVCAPVGVFDRHDRLGIARGRGSGHDAGALSCTDQGVVLGAGRQIGDHVERDRVVRARGGHIGQSYGVAVHAGIVEGWHIDLSKNVGGQNSPQCQIERDALGGKHAGCGENGGEVLVG